MAAGRFITFEGIEGVGKSTQIAVAARHLAGRGIDPVVTREPGGTPVAERIRRLALEPQGEPIDGTAELLLMFAARAVHLANLVEPALAAGRWVLCDRFTDATEAYQGAGRGVPLEHIRELERIAQHGRRPDLTLLLDAPVELALERARARQGDPDRFEAEHAAFFERVRDGYLAILGRERARVRRIDASRPVAEVSEAVLRVLDEMLDSGHG